ENLVVSNFNIAATAYSFFFQAEDGIRDPLVTGVQTCALPISGLGLAIDTPAVRGGGFLEFDYDAGRYTGVFELTIVDIVSVKAKIGRASCRESVCIAVSAGGQNEKIIHEKGQHDTQSERALRQ